MYMPNLKYINGHNYVVLVAKLNVCVCVLLVNAIGSEIANFYLADLLCLSKDSGMIATTNSKSLRCKPYLCPLNQVICKWRDIEIFIIPRNT